MSYTINVDIKTGKTAVRPHILGLVGAPNHPKRLTKMALREARPKFNLSPTNCPTDMGIIASQLKAEQIFKSILVAANFS